MNYKRKFLSKNELILKKKYKKKTDSQAFDVF